MKISLFFCLISSIVLSVFFLWLVFKLGEGWSMPQKKVHKIWFVTSLLILCISLVGFLLSVMGLLFKYLDIIDGYGSSKAWFPIVGGIVSSATGAGIVAVFGFSIAHTFMERERLKKNYIRKFQKKFKDSIDQINERLNVLIDGFDNYNHDYNNLVRKMQSEIEKKSLTQNDIQVILEKIDKLKKATHDLSKQVKQFNYDYYEMIFKANVPLYDDDTDAIALLSFENIFESRLEVLNSEKDSIKTFSDKMKFSLSYEDNIKLFGSNSGPKIVLEEIKNYKARINESLAFLSYLE